MRLESFAAKTVVTARFGHGITRTGLRFAGCRPVAYASEFNSVEQERRMNVSLKAMALLTAAVAVTSASAVGCSSNPKSPTASSGSAPAATTSHSSAASSAQAQSADYARLLIQASDIQSPVPFTAGP